jgi:hypothetical protein
MAADELEGFLENRMPLFIKRHADWMPKEWELVATIVIRRMFPAVRQPCRAPIEKVPGYPFWPYVHRSQGSHLHGTYQPTFFEKFTDSRVMRQLAFLNGAFNKLAPRRGMPKSKDFQAMLGSSGDDRTSFLSADHPTEMKVNKRVVNVRFGQKEAIRF